MGNDPFDDSAAPAPPAATGCAKVAIAVVALGFVALVIALAAVYLFA